MTNANATEKETTLSWNSIGNIEAGRKNLGSEMPIFAYRLLQFSMKEQLDKKFGKEATIEIFRKTGETAGKLFANNMLNLSLPFNEFIAQLQDVLLKNKIGILRMEKFDTVNGNAILTIAEDLDCSGLPIIGDTVCNYDEGFIAGILKSYTKNDYTVTEIDCWASGARICRFSASISN